MFSISQLFCPSATFRYPIAFGPDSTVSTVHLAVHEQTFRLGVIPFNPIPFPESSEFSVFELSFGPNFSVFEIPFADAMFLAIPEGGDRGKRAIGVITFLDTVLGWFGGFHQPSITKSLPSDLSTDGL